jgi:23S rRNA (cytosine1962-C5)-methyltransferase
MSAYSPPAAAAAALCAARVQLRPKKSLPFYGRHPWVLDSGVQKVMPIGDNTDLDGQIVELLNDKGRFIARGLYNAKSRIRVRLLTWKEDEAIDRDFWRRRIAQAVEMRRQIGYEGALFDPPDLVQPVRSSSATRLVFSEADGLSGLVIDRYGDYLVLQPTALGMAQRTEEIAEVLQELIHPRGIVLRSDAGAAKMEGIELPDGKFWGQMPTEPITIVENDVKYTVDLCEGQKTGFYLDQRENRAAVAKYLAGKQVLDMFCYTGGFALNAAKAGAADVLAVDSSKKAIHLARDNAAANGVANVNFVIGDGFETLDQLQAEGRKFDAVILDPPKFARSRSSVPGALMAYHRLNRSAVALLSPGGLFVTCSCSGTVAREDFLLMLSGVAQKTGRDIQILETRGAAADHPVSATCLETEYLKCFICRVN